MVRKVPKPESAAGLQKHLRAPSFVKSPATLTAPDMTSRGAVVRKIPSDVQRGATARPFTVTPWLLPFVFEKLPFTVSELPPKDAFTVPPLFVNVPPAGRDGLARSIEQSQPAAVDAGQPGQRVR